MKVTTDINKMKRVTVINTVRDETQLELDLRSKNMISTEEANQMAREQHERDIFALRRQREDLDSKIKMVERAEEVEELKKNLESLILTRNKLETKLSVADYGLKRKDHVIDDQSRLLILARNEITDLKNKFEQLRTQVFLEAEDNEQLRERVQTLLAGASTSTLVNEKLKKDNELLSSCNTNQSATIRKLRLELEDAEGSVATVHSPCGQKMVLIRGKHPMQDRRWTCPQCTTEKLDNIHELSSFTVGEAMKEDTTKPKGREWRLNP